MRRWSVLPRASQPFAPGGLLAASARKDGGVHLLTLADSGETASTERLLVAHTFPTYSEPVRAVRCVPGEGPPAIVALGRDDVVRLWTVPAPVVQVRSVKRR